MSLSPILPKEIKKNSSQSTTIHHAYNRPIQDPAVQPAGCWKFLHFFWIFQHIRCMTRWNVAINLCQAPQKMKQTKGDWKATTPQSSDVLIINDASGKKSWNWMLACQASFAFKSDIFKNVQIATEHILYLYANIKNLSTAYNIASVKCCFYPKWKLVEFLSLSQNLIPTITFKDPIVVMPWSINTAIPALAATHAPIAVLLTNPATSAERCACERVYLNKCDSCAVHEFAWECFQVDGNNHSTRSECNYLHVLYI